MPIFDYGSNKASLDGAKIEKQIEVADYEARSRQHSRRCRMR